MKETQKANDSLVRKTEIIKQDHLQQNSRVKDRMADFEKKIEELRRRGKEKDIIIRNGDRQLSEVAILAQK